ncbi:hypothetical protein BLSTO_00960 [Blastocystis sp. subtype 1]
MSTLMAYAKAFGLATSKEMSHMELATIVAHHFLGNTIDEQKVIREFYEKTENVKRNPEQSLADNAAYTIPKRQTKKPKKYTQNEEGAYHYNTRSRVADTAEKEQPKDTATGETAETIQYCICGNPENEDMVECENPECKHKWFHYSCVGIDDPNNLPNTWYCPECRELMQKQ